MRYAPLHLQAHNDDDDDANDIGENVDHTHTQTNTHAARMINDCLGAGRRLRRVCMWPGHQRHASPSSCVRVCVCVAQFESACLLACPGDTHWDDDDDIGECKKGPSTRRTARPQ